MIRTPSPKASRKAAWLLGATLAVAGTVATPPVSTAQTVTAAPATTLQVATGRGRLITLPVPMSDLFVANPGIADVQVRSPTQLYIFGKSAGETSVYATSKAGKVIYSTTVRVGNNIDSVGQMLTLAMPDAHIVATPLNGTMLLTGTVAAPDDAAEAQRLVQAFLGDTVKVMSRLRMNTPLQVNLQVRIAEVSRSFVKNIGVNLTTRGTGNNLFSFQQGRQGTITTAAGTLGSNVVDTTGALPGQTVFTQPAATGVGSTLGFAKHFLGMDVLSSLDLGETIGQVTTLANPNLTVLSGETASFLAGGEIPIVVSQGIGAVSVEYKQYGVSLSYTPTVLSDGRISLRVRPEVSQLSSVGAISLNGTTIQALTTRRVETTAELGSGQSMVIGGLLQNDQNNSISKAPGLGDVPVLGALFRSNAWQRNETELMIVITPYLVKPVNASDIVLPTDGYKAPSDIDRVLLGQLGGGTTGGSRPKPTMAPPATVMPALGAVAPSTPAAPMPTPADPAIDDRKAAMPPKKSDAQKPGAAVAPGFSLN